VLTEAINILFLRVFCATQVGSTQIPTALHSYGIISATPGICVFQEKKSIFNAVRDLYFRNQAYVRL
jgi:hypothetical protein